MAEPAAEPDYSVPALDKALDVLELLAGRKEGLTQQQIAAAVGRSASQIFRTLSALEARGYILRERPAGLYFLSMRLFELAHQHAPTRGLVQVAMPAMREFSEAFRQSCNLSVADRGRVLVLAEAESPAPFGFRVRVGTSFDMLGSATGRVLLAFQIEEQRAGWLAMAGGPGKGEAPAWLSRLPSIRERGFEETPDALHPGVTDLAFPLLDRAGHAAAALTVPYVATSYSGEGLGNVRTAALAAARVISAALGAI